MPKRRAYSEGEWFGLPLDGGGFGAAIVVRDQSSRARVKELVLAGLPIRFEKMPNADDVCRKSIHSIRCMVHTGATCIINGDWTLICKHPGFSRAAWPLLPVPCSNRCFATIDNNEFEFADFARSLIDVKLHSLFLQPILQVCANAMEAIIPDVVVSGTNSRFYYRITRRHVAAYEQVRGIVAKHACQR